MKLDQLEIFLEVTRAGSFSQASRSLHITQQALSACLRQMEADVGAILLVRSAKGVSLTAAGMEFRAFATSVLAQYRDLKKNIGTACPGIGGLLQVYVNSTFYLERLFYIVERMCGQYPDIKVTTSARSHAGICECLEAPSEPNVHRIGLLNLPAPASDYHFGKLGFHPLVDAGYHACMSRSHPLAGQRRLSIKRLLREPVVIALADQSDTTTLYRLLRRYGTPNIVLATTSLNVWRHSIASNLGIGFLHDIFLDGSEPFRTSLKDLIKIPLVEDMKAVTGYLVNGVPGPVIETFISFLPETGNRKLP